MSARVFSNPIHPLDLSLNSLLVIYKKFEEAKRVSGNPHQQLSIDLLVQLISRLINQEPSLLQKELTKSLYKKTISWNEFLNFLDHESEARQSILDWVMHETNTRQFKFYRQVHVKFLGHFDEISMYQPILISGKQHTLMLLDKERFVMYDNATQKIVIQMKIKRQKQKFFDEEKPKQVQQRSNPSMLQSNVRQSEGTGSYIRKSKRQASSKMILGTEGCQQSPKQRSNSVHKKNHARGNSITLADEICNIDDQSYILKEKKKIHAAFDIFKQLPIDSSHELANFVTNKIHQRKLGQVNVVDLKQTYKDYLNRKRDWRDIPDIDADYQNRFAQVKNLRKRLQDDNQRFSHDPFKSNTRPSTNPLGNRMQMERKRLNYEKKQKQNDLQVRTMTYLQKHNLIAAALYNFQLVLLQISKDFNKIHMTQQDRIRVPKQTDRKKNEVIEKIIFHFHQISQSYQILVLIRVENYSYLRIFNVKEVQSKKEQNQFDIVEKSKEIKWPQQPKKTTQKGQNFIISKQVFNIQLNFEAMNMVEQHQFGFHIVGYGGWFKSYKDDLTPNQQIYSLHHSQRFKGDMVFSCMALSKTRKKIMFGTVGGLVCFYDSFSKQMFFTKKVSHCIIIQVLFDEVHNQALAFSSDEVLTVFDVNKLEQIQVLNVRNENRLNQKATMFSLSYARGETVLSFFGSEFRQFMSYIDGDRNNKRRKIQSTYRWRQKKLYGDITQPIIKYSKSESEQIISMIQIDKYFVTMSSQLELKLYSRKSYKIKFSLILALSEQQSFIAFNISRDAKILVYSTQDQKIRIVNVYTEEVYQVLSIQQKITHFQFLSDRNEYFLVTGSECGKVSFIPSYLSQGKLANKVMQIHKKPLLVMVTVAECLITTSQQGLIVIWQLPFNVIRFEINIAQKRPRQCIIDVSQTNNFRRIICRGTSGVIYELDAKQGVIKDAHQELCSINILSTCSIEDSRELFLIDQDLKLTIYEQSLQSGPTLHKARSYLAPDKTPTFRRAFTKARGSSPTKKKSDSAHQLQNPSRWKVKSMHQFDDKEIGFVKILPNPIMGSTAIFLSKDFFYIYDHAEDRIQGKYSYLTGQFVKNLQKIPHQDKTWSLKKV